MPYNITIDHDSTPHSSDHTSSSVSDGEESSGTDDQVSPSSLGESQEYSEQLEGTEGWLSYPDDINPSDSASRPRTSNHHRPVVEAPTPAQAHRQPSRRQATRDRIHHHPHPRTHRPPPPHHSESVDPNEDWPGYGRGPPLPHGRGYPHWAHVVPPTSSPTYTPSYSSTQGYSPFPSTSVVPAGQLVPFTSPAGGYAYAPYQSQGGGSNPGYFPPGQQTGPPLGNPVAPHNLPPYGGQEVIPHNSAAAFYSYNNQGYPMTQPMAQPMGQPMAAPPMFHAYPTLYSPPPVLPSTPSPAPVPAPAENPKDDDKYEEKFDEKFARLEKILMDQKAEQEAKEAAAKKAAEDQAAKAAADKQRADEIAAAASAAAAAATEEAEKRAAEKAAIDAAKVAEEAAKASEEAAKNAEEVTKAAEETAKAREEAAKAAEEAAKAKEEAAQIKAAADEAAAAAAAAAMPPPPPQEKKKPIKFKDAVGRKFSFPFHLCNTWLGMEELIRQAFLHVDVIGPHVAEGHYDLVGPHGEIILPQVWETMIEPDWVITMHMWPIPEPPPPPPKAEEPPPEPAVEVPPPPPPTPPVETPDVVVVVPEGDYTLVANQVVRKKLTSPAAKKKKKPKPSPFAWYGSRPAKPKSLKVLKKPEDATQHDIVCRVM